MSASDLIPWNGVMIRADSQMWGGVPIPKRQCVLGFCVVGTTGSGKTTQIRLLLELQIPAICENTNQRAVIYDPKGEMARLITGIRKDVPYKILNPFDKRCYAWDLAADINNRQSAEHAASVLLPKRNEREPYFTEAAQDVVYCVLAALTEKKPKRWTLRDVLLALEAEDRVRALTNDFNDLKYAVRAYSKAREYPSIRTTIRTHMRQFAAIANAWYHTTLKEPERKISLAEWMREPSVLLLGRWQEAEEQLAAINRVILKRLNDYLLDSPSNSPSQDSPDDQFTWFILDEFGSLGRMEFLASLLTEGRGHGACNVLGFQNIQHIFHNYGDKLAKTILGNCNHLAVFATGIDFDSAHWASDVFGDVLIKERQRTTNQQGASTSWHKALRKVVLPNEIEQLPFTERSTGMTGYFVAPDYGVYRNNIPGDLLFDHMLSPVNKSVPGIVHRDREPLFPEWNDAELVELGLKKKDVQKIDEVFGITRKSITQRIK